MATFKEIFREILSYCDKKFESIPESEPVDIDTLKEQLLDIAHPVGSYYWSSVSTSPQTLFGGTWVQVKDKFILAVGDSYTDVGVTGGEATHILTADETPAHSHTRGTMEISGTVQVKEAHGRLLGFLNPTKAFTATDSGVIENPDGGADTGGSGNRTLNFTASKGWTGSTSSVGGGLAHNNMPPYETAYCWRRTA